MFSWLAFVMAFPSCSDVTIAAHRGGIGSEHPENTLPAFSEALGNGVSFIEIDLRSTADGHVVIVHDKSVERTTDGTGLVHELTLAEIRRLDAGAGTVVPTLGEVLEWAGPLDIELLLDVKKAPLLDLDQVAGAVLAARLEQRVLFGVRSLADLRSLSRHSPDLRFLGFVPDVEDIEDFIAAGAGIIRLWPKWVAADPDLVGELRARGIPVWVTVGAAGPDRMQQYAAMGVDGMIADYPGAAGCQ